MNENMIEVGLHWKWNNPWKWQDKQGSWRSI